MTKCMGARWRRASIFFIQVLSANNIPLSPAKECLFMYGQKLCSIEKLYFTVRFYCLIPFSDVIV